MFDDYDDEVLNDGIDEVLVGVRWFVVGQTINKCMNYKWMIQLKEKRRRVVDQIRPKEVPTRKWEGKKGWMKLFL